MTNDEIETLVSQCHYVKKPQPDGSMAFHPHVFESHRKAYEMGFAEGAKQSERLSCSKSLAKCYETLNLATSIRDSEAAHSMADDALCDLLEALGFKAVVEQYKCVEKWYA